MRNWWLAAVTVGALGCGANEPLDVSMTGTWVATVNALGIAELTLNVVEDSRTITATGQWTSLSAAGSRPVTANGLHFETTLTMVLTFDTPTGPVQFSTQGQVDSPTTFHLIFPVADNPTRVNFQRQ